MMKIVLRIIFAMSLWLMIKTVVRVWQSCGTIPVATTVSVKTKSVSTIPLWDKMVSTDAWKEVAGALALSAIPMRGRIVRVAVMPVSMDIVIR
jgi:hypothetical protein